MIDPYQQYPRREDHQSTGRTNSSLRGVAAVTGIAVLFLGCAAYLFAHLHGKRGLERAVYNLCLINGQAKHDRHDYVGAIDDYSMAIAADPIKSLGYIRRGNAYLALKKDNEALADYSKSLQVLTTPAGVDELGNLSDTHAQKVAMLPVARANLYHNIGLAYLDQGDFTHAISAFTATLKLRPRYVDAYSLRVWTYSSMHKWREALADADTAIRLEPGNVGIRRQRASLYARMGDPRRGIAEYMLAIQLAPKDGQTYDECFQTAEYFHLYAYSVACWRTAVKNNPENTKYWVCLGWAQYLNGQVKESIEASQKAIDLGNMVKYIGHDDRA